jgi:hypothetical protein
LENNNLENKNGKKCHSSTVGLCEGEDLMEWIMERNQSAGKKSFPLSLIIRTCSKGNEF